VGSQAVRAALLLVLLLVGCLGPATPHERARPDPPCDLGCGQPAPLRLEAPTLPNGRAWTYHVDGIYNTGGEMTTVVVAKPDGSYLFAGAKESDLVESAVWGARVWQGDMDASINPKGLTRYAWPLQEGASWAYSTTMDVTAHVASVKLPNGSEEMGFAIEGAAGKRFVRYDYAPSVGSFTRFESGDGNGTYQRAKLLRVSEGAKPLWFEPSPSAQAQSGDPPATLVVPAGFDAVLASAGGTGGKAALVPPGGAPWTWDAEAKESWSYQSSPATVGPWALAANAQQGYAYVTAIAVKWTHPS